MVGRIWLLRHKKANLLREMISGIKIWLVLYLKTHLNYSIYSNLMLGLI